jgi:nucleoside-triphosphatase
VRTGFRIETVTGETGALARVGLTSPYRVGRYGVDLTSFEAVAVAELEAALARAGREERIVLVIDEVGKMELVSERFRNAVERAFSEVAHVVATIMQRRHPFADELKTRPDVTLIGVTAQNRDRLPVEALRWLR